MTRVSRGVIHFYQAWSATRPPTCRFSPTCSHYTEQAITEHGFVSGAWLGFRRICRCHPWGSSGFDPVPRKAN